MKNLKNIIAVFAVIVTFSATASAQATATAVAKNNEPFKVTYIGSENDYLYFQVEINATNSNYSLLKIDDKEEGELYSQSWKANSAVQTFKIEKKDGQELNFKLLTGNKVYNKSFSATTKLIEKTTVNENDMVVL
ncbi:MAG: hypothetical protein JST86_20400 [Bacteroidetes bacterium]|nr:hypothetical protein [Bacteroidota bacterium]